MYNIMIVISVASTSEWLHVTGTRILTLSPQTFHIHGEAGHIHTVRTSISRVCFLSPVVAPLQLW